MEHTQTDAAVWPGITALGAVPGTAVRDRTAARALMGVLSSAACITVLQVFVVLLFARPIPFYSKYHSMVRWDSAWYKNIVDTGYHSNWPPHSARMDRVNLSFFPGYPTAAWLVKGATGLPTDVALLMTSHLATFGFWAYFLLLAGRWGFSKRAMWYAAAVIAAFPTAFYFAAAYTESLFCMNLLGFIYWSTDKRKHSWIVAAAHGYVLSATRIVGAALCVLPAMFSAARARNLGGLFSWKTLLVGAATVSGALTYLAFSEFTFGDWRIPFIAADAAGWKGGGNYLGVFDPKLYKMFWPNLRIGVPDPNHLSRLTYPLMLIAMTGVFVADASACLHKAAGGLRARLPLYAATFILWFVYLGARYYNSAGSIRYALPMCILLTLAAAHFVTHSKKRWPSLVAELLVPAFVLVSLVIQTGYIDIFTGGGWVA